MPKTNKTQKVIRDEIARAIRLNRAKRDDEIAGIIMEIVFPRKQEEEN